MKKQIYVIHLSHPKKDDFMEFFVSASGFGLGGKKKLMNVLLTGS